jgi:nucleoside-diphosphate-sugar epimerase
MTTDQGKTLNILVTGGAGFLGRHIVQEFLAADSPVKAGRISIYDQQKFTGNIQDNRLETVQADILDYDNLNKACRDIDLVIHSAAIVDWGTHSEQEVYDVNVTGTENVIRACRENGVRFLIFTSSLDAVYSGKPLINIDESIDFPARHSNMYCRSKYLSEKSVIAENSEEFKTCVLRPADIYGEGDPYHIDSLINMARGGFYVRLGNGNSKCQHVYVGNIAFAHVLAAAALAGGNPNVPGQTYFITDGPAVNFFKFFDQIVEGAGYLIWPKNLWLPRNFAYAIGALSEFFAVLVRPVKRYNPKFSRFAVTYTCTDFTFSSARAIRDFGYSPKYTEKEALERTIAHYRKPLM